MGRLNEGTTSTNYQDSSQTPIGQQPEEYSVTRAGESGLDHVVSPPGNQKYQHESYENEPSRPQRTWATRSTIPSNNSPQVFPPPEVYPPEKPPHAFPPPEAYPPEKPPQAFPPAGDHDQVHSFPPQGEPVNFPPQHHHHHHEVYGNPNMSTFTPSAMNFSYPAANVNMGGSQGNPGGSPYGHNMMMNNNVSQGIPLSVPTNPWSSNLFDCMDDPENAIITACFPCVTFGQIAEIMDQGRTPCMTSGLLYGVIAFCIAAPCLISCGYRTKMRNNFGLEESPGPDWLVHCFCEWCALCQEYRELKKKGIDPAIGWQANSMQQVPMATMTPPMNPMMSR